MKIAASLLAVAMVAGVATGCSNNNSSDNGNDTAAETQEASDTADTTEGEVSAQESTEQSVIVVDAAASLEGVLTELIDMYLADHPDCDIVLNTGSSGDLMTQIEETAGVGVDLFFSAATSNMDELVEQGYVGEDNVENLLKNEIVLIGAKDSGTAVTGFANITDAANIALADETVPVGRYAREAFDSLGISVDDFAEVNACADVSAVKEAVKEGSNEVGVVYYSDYYSVKDDVDLIEICDQSLYSECIYPVGLVNNSEADESQIQLADDFVSFLMTDEAKGVFESYMFTIYE